ncbi:thioredoxin-dependent thiol peroxidase [Alphaproteobacteria bacterium]|nr:thioredoxin-dependent thiol peroxidase [Alphaproteobacteria bacterium]
MTQLNSGDKAPDFDSITDGGGTAKLSDYKGKKLILYFYPKDNTPGCTTESCDFRDNLTALQSLGAQIIGISKDSVKKHDNFKAKHNLNFPLISDENGTMCEDYDVWKEKSMYGKTYMGIERTTFLIDETGKIAHIWRKVKVKDHVDDVKNILSKQEKAA